MNLIPMSRFVVAAAITCASAGAFAQDAMKATPMHKKDMTMQDCKDRVTTAKGEKRNDTPANAETDKQCAEMMKNGDAKGMKKGSMPKNDTGAMPDKPNN